MEILKIILFVQFIAAVVCGVIHLIALLAREKFDLKMYLFVGIITFFATLLTIFIFIPIGEWFFSL